MRTCGIALVVLGIASAAYAQRGGPTYVRAGVQPELVKGAPYSAEVVNESTQTLSDGNRIVRRSTSRIYRDSEARTRREEDRGGPSLAITIGDPVAGTTWTLDVDNRTARQMPGIGRIFTANRLADDMERLTILLNGFEASVTTGTGGRGWIAVGNAANELHNEERLTPKTVEGLRVEGFRRTTTIAAGAIGNERPIVVTTDEWTSPDLKVVVLSEHSDPRTGTTTYKLVNVKRGDPPATLFQVPADYTVVQAPGRGAGARGGVPQPAPR